MTKAYTVRNMKYRLAFELEHARSHMLQSCTVLWWVGLVMKTSRWVHFW